MRVPPVPSSPFSPTDFLGVSAKGESYRGERERERRGRALPLRNRIPESFYLIVGFLATEEKG